MNRELTLEVPQPSKHLTLALVNLEDLKAIGMVSGYTTLVPDFARPATPDDLAELGFRSAEAPVERYLAGDPGTFLRSLCGELDRMTKSNQRAAIEFLCERYPKDLRR